MAPYL